MLSVAQLLLAAGSVSLLSPTSPPVLVIDSSRSVGDFAQCFMAARSAQNRPVWFVLNAGGGGRISNAGGPGIAGVYEIRYTPWDSFDQIQVAVEGGEQAWRQTLLKAVQSCS